MEGDDMEPIDERDVAKFAMMHWRHLRISHPDAWRSMLDDRSIIVECRSRGVDAALLCQRLRSGPDLSAEHAAEIVERFVASG